MGMWACGVCVIVDACLWSMAMYSIMPHAAQAKMQKHMQNNSLIYYFSGPKMEKSRAYGAPLRIAALRLPASILNID